MLNAVGQMTGYLAVFWEMATESLGMQIASVSSSWVLQPCCCQGGPEVMLSNTVAAAELLQNKGISYKFGEKGTLPSRNLQTGKGFQPVSDTYQ